MAQRTTAHQAVKGRGRPASPAARQNSVHVHITMTGAEFAVVEQIRVERFMPSVAATIRALVLQEAERRGISAAEPKPAIGEPAEG